MVIFGPASGQYKVQGLVRFFEVYLDGLGARSARDYDLLWHIASFLFLLFLFLSIPRGKAQFGASRARVDKQLLGVRGDWLFQLYF